jgi:hypothetical protein
MFYTQSLGRANGAWSHTSAVAQPAARDTIAYGLWASVPEGCHELSEHLAGLDLKVQCFCRQFVARMNADLTIRDTPPREVMLSRPSIAVRRHHDCTALQMTSSDMSIPRAVPRMRDAGSLCATRDTPPIASLCQKNLKCLDTWPQNGRPPPACPPLQGWALSTRWLCYPAVRTAALSRSCAGRPIQPGPCFETPSRQAIGACSSCRTP